jgi:glycosyltransferase involved in cell wall biosynthesis
MPSEIVVNGRFMARPITGVERYARDVTRALGGRVRLISPPGIFTRGAGHFWEQVLLPWALPLDARLWSPANSGPLAVANQVVTIHDLAPVERPDGYSRGFATWYGILLPRLARRATRVITVSDFSRQRLIELFCLPSEKIAVIPPGIDRDRFRPASASQIEQFRNRFALHKPFLLYLGSLQPRKNLDRLLQAWSRINTRYPGFELVLAGGGASHFLEPDLSRLPSGVRRLGRLCDDDLPALYTSALGVVIPSLYEGFCLVGLEALACGTAPAVAEIPAFREALGETALYFDPLSVEGMAAALDLFMSDESLRMGIVEQGGEQVGNFRLDRAVEQIWDVLNEP